MGYQVLARKWRPSKFEDVVGQDHITQSLKNAILRDQVGHAYLFAGTRGIGKTSVARIFSKAIRCHHRKEDPNPCLQCSSCREIDGDKSLDVIEIDGASHNGVDHIRQLVENIQFLPTSGEKRIYIIDEVHMLTKEAFNALLKTLEEPPSHVIFLFATTVPEKLLGTVLSRCQRLDFRNAQVEEIAAHLSHIAGQESIQVDSPFLLKQIATEAKGSLRDALSLLDQVLSFSTDFHITEETLAQSLGMARTSALKDILSALFSGDSFRCSRAFREVLKENVDLEKLALSLLDHLFAVIENRHNPDLIYQRDLVAEGVLDKVTMAECFWIYESLAKDLQWSLKSLDPEKVTEIVLQKICSRNDFFYQESHHPSPAPRPQETPPPEEMPKLVPKDKDKEVSAPVPVVPPAAPLPPPPALAGSWEEFLTFLFGVAPGLAANVEQGNLLYPPKEKEEGLRIELRFKETESVFLEYLKEKDVKERLLNFLSQFYNLPPERILLSIEKLEPGVVGDGEFKSLAEVDELKKEDILKRKKQDLLNHHFIRKAEELFNSKIDRVIINHHS